MPVYPEQSLHKWIYNGFRILYLQNPASSPGEAVSAAAKANCSAPVMVICGPDPWTSNLVYIVADGEVLLEVHEVCQAMCLLFAFYYVLNFEYPKSKENGSLVGTLSFLQKCVFEIKDGEKVLGRVETLASAVH